MTDITELAQSLKAAADREMIYRDVAETSEIWERTVTPENILALVEALENAQAENTSGVSGMAESYETTISMLRSRIAELESRTVKLPKLKMLEDYLAEVAIEERKQILVGVKLEFHRACVTAGIKVEAE